jgi:translocation and assembly module TamB
MTLPPLGVRWGTVRGRLSLAGDSLALQDVLLTSGDGNLNATGVIRLENLARPVLDVHLRANRFDAINARSFLVLTTTGNVDVRGPFYGATLTGSIVANDGELYFADLVTKQIIDLSDPLNAGLVDTALVRERGLGDAFQTRFLQELNVDDLNLEIGNDFWLRSNEANIKLGGRMIVNKASKQYRFGGTLEAERGTYILRVGPVSRDFTVERGEVRYFNTPDLNAELDIEARHVVRTVSNQEIPVIAKITGTLQAPRLALESTQRPPINETDLVSYLITGYPAGQARQFAQGSAVGSAAAVLFSAITPDLERALISDLGLPIDVLEIRPGFSQNSISAQALTTLAAGWQIGRKTFFTFNAGFCPNDLSQLSYRKFGASLEFRFSRAWRLQSSIEPTMQSCGPTTTARPFDPNTPYQFGTDLIWEREF